jgi:hypothetical protein
MRKTILIAAIVMAVTPLFAQHHPGKHTPLVPGVHLKVVTDEVTIPFDLRLGSEVLKAGKYRIDCDHATLRFLNLSSGRVLELKCEGSEMEVNATQTEFETGGFAPDGVFVVQRMYLRGSPIEHVFLY